jgi:ribonuclease P protein component
VETLTSAREIDALFSRGRRAADPVLVVLCARTPEGRSEQGRVVFVAGKKLGGAVWRNRSKRVLRAACRRAGGPWAGHDVALIARATTATVSADALDRSLAALLVKAGVTL